MELREWMETQDPPMTQAALAELLGVDQTSISKWLNDKRNIKLAEAFALERLTKGKVTAASWADKKQRRRRGKAA